MKKLFLFFVMLVTIYADCPSSSWGSTTKCKVSINDVTQYEGNSTNYMEFNISLNDTAAKDIKIDLKTKDDTAKAGDDYESDSETVTIPKGKDYVTIKIKIYGDTTPEANEDFFVDINVNDNSSDDAEIDDGEGKGTLKDDDADHNDSLLVVGDCRIDGGKNSPYDKIQDALNDAEEGDTVYICKGTYKENLTLKKDNITVTGDINESVNDIVIDGTFDIQGDNPLITHFKITNKITFESDSDANFKDIFSKSSDRGFELSKGRNIVFDDVNISAKNEGILVDSDVTGIVSFSNGEINSSDQAATYWKGASDFRFTNVFMKSKGSSFYIKTNNLGDMNVTNVKAIAGNDVVAVVSGYFVKHINIINSDMNSTDLNTWNIPGETETIYIKNSNIYTSEDNDNHAIYIEGKVDKNITIVDSKITGNKAAFWYKGSAECNITAIRSEFVANGNGGYGFAFHGETAIDHLVLIDNNFKKATEGNVIFNQKVVHYAIIRGNTFRNPGDNKWDVDIKLDGNPIKVNDNCFYGDNYIKIDKDGSENNFNGNYWYDTQDQDEDGDIDKSDTDKIGDYIVDNNPECKCHGVCEQPNTFDVREISNSDDDLNISTKKVNQSFILTAISYKEDRSAKKAYTGTVCSIIVDKNGNRIGDWNKTIWDKDKEKNISLSIPKALKEAYVELDSTDDTNASCPLTEYNKSVSTDPFAVRPDKFVFKIVPSNTIKAGEEFNVTIEAVDVNGNPVNNYNEPINIKGNSVDLDYLELNNDCLTGKLKGDNLQFKDGKADLTLKYSEIGKLKLIIKEVIGSEFAKIDENDTAINDRLISSDYNDKLVFIPNDFKVEAVLNNYDNGSYTYISNDLNMSSTLNIKITAQNKDGTTTKNYNNKCYAKDIEVNISNSVDGDIDTKMIFKFDKESDLDINKTIVLSNVSKDYFSTDENGSANLSIKINFEKDYSKPINEFNFEVNKISVSNVDGIKGDKSFNLHSLFRYGRVNIENTSAVGNKIETSFKYEYWDSSKGGWIVNKSHTILDGDIIKNQSTIPSTIDSFTLNPIDKGSEKVTITTKHALPYIAKLHLAIPNYLWYHPLAKDYKNPTDSSNCLTHPCMRVSFKTTGKDWGGIGLNIKKYKETNRTVRSASNKKEEINKEEVEKIIW